MKHSLPAKKSLGQHFLTNPKVIETMVEAAHTRERDTVLEIGPGTGILTEGLLRAGARVIAIEADVRAVSVLRERFAEEVARGALTLHHADVRETAVADYVSPNEPYSVVSNIPYYLSGMLIRMCLSAQHQPKAIVFLVQKEVALRIAREEKESLLSLSVKAYGTPSYIMTVSRGNFTPPPKVDSAVLLIADISRNTFRHVSEERFFEILHAGFAAKRKQLVGNLGTLFKKERILEVFRELSIPEKARGEDIPIETWLALVERLEKSK